MCVSVCVCVCVCVCACACASARARARVRVRVCVCVQQPFRAHVTKQTFCMTNTSLLKYSPFAQTVHNYHMLNKTFREGDVKFIIYNICDVFISCGATTTVIIIIYIA